MASIGLNHRAAPIVLILLAIALALPGLVSLFAPGVFAGPLFASPLGVDAMNETRAVGGTRLGVACVLAYAAWSGNWRRPGLILGIVVFGGTLLGRLLSTGLDGVPGPMLKPEIAEVILLALSFAALRRVPAKRAT